MGKDREEVRTDGSGERRTRQPPRDGMPYALDGDFERAFADALHDILIHERRRRAA